MKNGFMTEKEAAVALVSYYTDRGPVNGGFANKLIEAFTKADGVNRERLLLGFPEFRKPLEVANSESMGDLERKIEGGYFSEE